MAIKYVFGVTVLGAMNLLFGIVLLAAPSTNSPSRIISSLNAADVLQVARHSASNNGKTTAISADGDTVIRLEPAANEDTAEIRLFSTDAATDTIPVALPLTELPVLSRLSPDGDLLAMITIDNTLMLWDIGIAAEKLQINLTQSDVVQDMVWSLDNTRLLLTFVDGDFIAFDTQNGQALTFALGDLTNNIKALTWDDDNSLLAIVTVEGYHRLWSSRTNDFAIDVNLPDGISTFAMSPTEPMLVYGTVTGEVGLADVSTGDLIRILEGHAASIASIQWSPDGKHFLTIDAEGVQILWGSSAE